MSKKHRVRHEFEMRAFIEDVAFEMMEAKEFLEEATPFEISVQLAEMGARTTGAAEIRAILNRFEPPGGSDSDERYAYHDLAETWIEEIESRGRSLSFADSVLVTEIAKYYWDRFQPSSKAQLPG